MRTRHLQTRFILAGVALVMMTIVSGLWSAWTFARLSTVAGRTIRSSQRIIDLTPRPRVDQINEHRRQGTRVVFGT